jgi:hypothetical protein
MYHLAQSETVATSGAVVDTDNLKEIHPLLQGMDLRELLDLAHNVEDDALSENGGQPPNAQFNLLLLILEDRHGGVSSRCY